MKGHTGEHKRSDKVAVSIVFTDDYHVLPVNIDESRNTQKRAFFSHRHWIVTLADFCRC